MTLKDDLIREHVQNLDAIAVEKETRDRERRRLVEERIRASWDERGKRAFQQITGLQPPRDVSVNHQTSSIRFSVDDLNFEVARINQNDIVYLCFRSDRVLISGRKGLAQAVYTYLRPKE